MGNTTPAASVQPPLSATQKQALWKLAREHQLFLLTQGTQRFDDALFSFAAEAANLLNDRGTA